MKPETVRTLVAWFWIVMAFIIALLMWVYTRPASAEEMPPPEIVIGGSVGMTECKLPGCLIVNARELQGLFETNESLATRLAAATEELAKLKKGCAAKLEVVPDGTRKRS